MTIDVLLVAPASNLEWQAVEVETLVNLANVRVRLVRSPATHRSIDAAVDAILATDVLWFAGHGSPSGVEHDHGGRAVALPGGGDQHVRLGGAGQRREQTYSR
jgi:hypothetical protein